jgi:hypothetical protein
MPAGLHEDAIVDGYSVVMLMTKMLGKTLVYD